METPSVVDYSDEEIILTCSIGWVQKHKYFFRQFRVTYRNDLDTSKVPSGAGWCFSKKNLADIQKHLRDIEELDAKSFLGEEPYPEEK